MANGASRLFKIIQNTSEGTNPTPSQAVSLTVKSINPLVLNRDDKLDITEEFCIFNNIIDVDSLVAGDKLIAFAFNEGQVYFIQQRIDDNPIDYIKNIINEYILENNKLKYHIGKIIIDTANINPATYLGFGTWVPWGTGRVPVGVDLEDEDFDEVEKTGGEKTHTLTVDEIPAHNHRINTNNDDWNNSEGGGNFGTTHDGTWNFVTNNWFTQNAGGGEAHNNIQPYITCYMWKRIS